MSSEAIAARPLAAAGAAPGLADLLRSFEAGLLADPRPELAPLVSWRAGADQPVHRWLRYREGYSPDLIDALGLGPRTLDPFCGTGSILVGSARRGLEATGIELNPLAALAARVQLSPLDEADRRAVARFLDRFEAGLPTTAPAPAPHLKVASKVFEPQVLDTLLRLRAQVDAQPGGPGRRAFLLLAWLAVLEDVGSFFKEGNGIKYRNRKRVRGGYVPRPEGEWQARRFGPDQRAFVCRAFATHLGQMLADTEVWAEGTWADQRLVEGDALAELGRLEPGSFDSVVFSPPYANRFDYFEAQKVELWFGGFVGSYDELGALRKRSLRSHLGAALDGADDPARARARALVARTVPELEDLLGRIDPASYAARSRVPDLVRGYADDLAVVLAGVRRALRPGGAAHVVVGASAYGGVIVPADVLVARLALASGFAEARVVPVRHLTVAPQQRSALRGLEDHMRESVVTLR